MKLAAAVKLPNVACSLFVANATCSGIPTAINAGMVISPPPPAIASINPLKNATKNRILPNLEFQMSLM